MPAPKKREKDQHIQVVVRCRPLNSMEKKQGSYNIVEPVPDRREVTIKERVALNAPTKTYTFDRVFGPQAKQLEVYKTTVVPIIEEVLLGYNCTIFAYGQTGTGKTFTMEGERSEDSTVTWEEDPLAGIVPRAMNQLFFRLDKMSCEYTVRASYLEIYNEELVDLLGAESVENPRLKIYEDNTKKGSHVIQGLEDVIVHDQAAVYSILERGTQRRQTASTLMNARSSRSHTLFMVTIHMRENSVDGEEIMKTGKLNLVDLAGSECVGKSGAVDKRLREAGTINQSLLTLGRVITSLVEHAPHIPYRESKLTRLLQDSLGGRTKTSIIATISPASINLDETLSTLDYAHRAKNITNRPEINQKLTKKALLKEYTEEMERLRRDLQAARDKNGIYLNTENYDAMVTQINQQKDHIKDIEEQMNSVSSEMYQLTGMFTETKEELAQKAEQLELTAQSLEETKESLERTQQRLRVITQDRDEQKHLVTEQVKTETKLHGQASQLLYTVDEATSDVAGLHAKLDRKKAVDSHNETAQERFTAQFRRDIDSMQNLLHTFTESRLSTLSSMDSTLGSVLSKTVTDSKQMSQDIAGVVAMVTEQLRALHQSQTEHTQQTETWGREITDSCQQARDTEISRQAQFFEDVLQAVMPAIDSRVAKLTSDLETLQHTIDLQKQKLVSETGQFLEQHMSCLGHQRSLVSDFVNSHSTELDRLREQNQTLLESQKQHNQDQADKCKETMIQALAELVAAQNSHLTQSFGKTDDHLVKSKTSTNTFGSDANSHLDKFTTSLQGAHDTLQNRLSDNNTVCKSSSDKLQASVGELQTDLTNLTKKLSEHSDTSQQVCAAEAERLIVTVTRHVDDTKTQLDAHNTDTQSLSTCCTSMLTDMDQRQTTQQSDLEQRVQDIQAALADHCKSVSDWTAGYSTDIAARNQDVESFLGEEIHKDMPTGTTPQRRDFSYPQSLTRTGRHSLLLSEFRKTYLLEDAINLPVPDDSFQSTASSSIPPLVLDDMDEDETPGDIESDTDLSDCSHHTNSSTTSNKMLRSESKENVMGPPKSTLPVKSRNNSNKVTPRKKKSSNREEKPTTPNKSRHTPGKRPKAESHEVQGSTSRLPLRPSNSNQS